MPEEQFTIYLMGHSALDRDAYRLLLRHEFEMEIATESNFAPTAVWAAMRSKPELVLVATDTPTERSAIRSADDTAAVCPDADSDRGRVGR